MRESRRWRSREANKYRDTNVGRKRKRKENEGSKYVHNKTIKDWYVNNEKVTKKVTFEKRKKKTRKMRTNYTDYRQQIERG